MSLHLPKSRLLPTMLAIGITLLLLWATCTALAVSLMVEEYVPAVPAVGVVDTYEGVSQPIQGSSPKLQGN